MPKQGRRSFFKLIGIIAGMALWSGVGLPVVFGQEMYPAKRITWINFTKAGGGSDIMARTVASYLSKYLKEVSKQPKGGEIVVRNESGASGRKAFNMIYHAAPDGYTIGDFNSTFVTENIGSKSEEFDYNKFTFLARIGVSLPAVVTHKNGPKGWDEMMKQGQKKELKWACGQFGMSAHTSSILLKEAAQVPARLVNFPGSVETVNALLRGDVDIGTVGEGAAKAMIQAGELRVLAVVTEVQAKRYPGVPTLAKLGAADLADPLGQHCLIIGPPNLPKEIVDTLITNFKKVFGDKDLVADVFQRLNFDIAPLYGLEVERRLQTLAKFYEEKAPVLAKYLK
jgi:tripartite-type tricarboxylate transporter receptor subunit TctC